MENEASRLPTRNSPFDFLLKLIQRVSEVKSNHLGLFLLFSFMLIGILNHGQYGMTWDEEAQHETGMHTFKYIISPNEDLLQYKDRDYGVAIELPLFAIEKILGITDVEEIYKTRHLLAHWFYLIAAFFCFRLVYLLYQSKILAVFGFLLIVLMPIFYAHSYFNTKDLPFAAMHLICFYLAAVAFKSRKWRDFAWLGVSIGLLINIRIMGVLFLIVVLFSCGLELFWGERGWPEFFRKAGRLCMVLLVALGTLYVTWPFLWEHPIGHFKFALKNMAHFRWDLANLFNGEYEQARYIPWNYVPVWIAITTPIYYLLAAVVGLCAIAIRFGSKPIAYLKSDLGRNNLIYVLCLFGPIIAVIVFHSVLYDGWRQTFFAYPPLAMLAVHGLHMIMRTKVRKWIIGLSIVAFGHITFFMIRSNPHQYLYFNEIITLREPEYIRKNWEFDFWAIAYKQSMEYIEAHDSSPVIEVATSLFTGDAMLNILPPKSRARFRMVEPEEATYFITSYRWHPLDFDEYEGKSWKAFKLFDNTYNEIFKLK